jgi:hypothetical protein
MNSSRICCFYYVIGGYHDNVFFPRRGEIVKSACGKCLVEVAKQARVTDPEVQVQNVLIREWGLMTTGHPPDADAILRWG